MFYKEKLEKAIQKAKKDNNRDKIDAFSAALKWFQDEKQDQRHWRYKAYQSQTQTIGGN